MFMETQIWRNSGVVLIVPTPDSLDSSLQLMKLAFINVYVGHAAL